MVSHMTSTRWPPARCLTVSFMARRVRGGPDRGKGHVGVLFNGGPLATSSSALAAGFTRSEPQTAGGI